MVLTRNRDCERMLALLDMLRGRFDHPDARECYQSMRKMIPNIGQSTVYRHLSKLVDSGLIIELHPETGPARFDAKTDQHSHFYCTSCQMVIDAPNITLNGSWPGDPSYIEIIAKGVCKRCKSS